MLNNMGNLFGCVDLILGSRCNCVTTVKHEIDFKLFKKWCVDDITS